MNFIPCQLEKIDGVVQISMESGGKHQQLPIKQTIAGLENYVGKKVVLGIRPEQITQQGESKDDSAMMDCAIEIIEPTGPDTLITARINGVKTICRIHPTAQCKIGEPMPLQFDMSKVVFFDSDNEERIY